MVLAPLVTPLLICLLWGQLQQLLGTTPGQVCTVIYFIKIGFLLTIHGVLSLSPLHSNAFFVSSCGEERCVTT